MASQDCPNCHYPAPDLKKPGETEECAQCFYQPEAAEKQPEECAQCFYQPESEKEREKDKEGECSQCFYKPEK